MVGDLVTWETVKNVLNLEEERKELTEFLISSASAQAEKIADRILAARDVELKLDGNGGKEIMLPSYPINSITLLTVSGAVTDYSMKENIGIIRLNYAAPEGWGNILFKGNIGYNPVPMDLQQAVIEVISANLRRLAGVGGTVGIKSMSANGAVTTQYEIDIPISSRTVFNSYRSARI